MDTDNSVNPIVPEEEKPEGEAMPTGTPEAEAAMPTEETPAQQ